MLLILTQSYIITKKMIKKIFLFFKRNEKFSFFILLFIIGIIGYCSTLTSGPPIGPSFSWMAVAYHFTIFFSFTFFLLLTTFREKINKKWLFILGISLIIAILDETHQIFIPFRDASIIDAMTDFSGSVLSLILFSLINKKLSKDV
jgi:hypothetical protein